MPNPEPWPRSPRSGSQVPGPRSQAWRQLNQVLAPPTGDEGNPNHFLFCAVFSLTRGLGRTKLKGYRCSILQLHGAIYRQRLDNKSLRKSFGTSSMGFVSVFFLNKFIYLFLAPLGLRCCARAFSSCGEWGLLIAVTSLVPKHGL